MVGRLDTRTSHITTTSNMFKSKAYEGQMRPTLKATFFGVFSLAPSLFVCLVIIYKFDIGNDCIDWPR